MSAYQRSLSSVLQAEVRRIAEQLDRSFRGPAWYGQSILEALGNTTAAEATAHLYPGQPSIWEMLLHLAAWQEVVISRIEGVHLSTPLDSEWPPVLDSSEDSWQAVLNACAATHEKLKAIILRLRDEQLELQIGSQYGSASVAGVSIYSTLHGVVQHNVYHAAQILLIRKTLENQPQSGAPLQESLRTGSPINEYS